MEHILASALDEVRVGGDREDGEKRFLHDVRKNITEEPPGKEDVVRVLGEAKKLMDETGVDVGDDLASSSSEEYSDEMMEAKRQKEKEHRRKLKEKARKKQEGGDAGIRRFFPPK